jgi:hypothetical protein
MQWWKDNLPDLFGEYVEDMASKGIQVADAVERYNELSQMSTEQLEKLHEQAWQKRMNTLL